MFDEVTKREGGKRAASRSVWVAGSFAVQVALIAAILVLSVAVAHQKAEAPMVDVKLVRSATPPPPPPPPAPPAAPAAKRPPSKPKTTEAPHPAPSMVQPKDMPTELKPPEPAPAEPEGAGEGVEGGVIGGVAGGVVGGAPAAPPKPTAPVKFDATMSKPIPVSPPQIEYTQSALEHEVEGTMVVECLVHVDGTVRNCKVVKGVPFMESTVVAALQRARYKPATLSDGTPVECIYDFVIKLTLPQ